MKIRSVAVALAVAMLSACGGKMAVKTPLVMVPDTTPTYVVDDVTNQETKAPGSFLVILKEKMESSLKDEGLLAPAGLATARHIKVVLTKYKMRGDAARFMFGFFAGSDAIDTTVTVADDTGANIGETQVHAFNAMAIGTNQTVCEYHAQQVTNFIKGVGTAKEIAAAK